MDGSEELQISKCANPLPWKCTGHTSHRTTLGNLSTTLKGLEGGVVVTVMTKVRLPPTSQQDSRVCKALASKNCENSPT